MSNVYSVKACTNNAYRRSSRIIICLFGFLSLLSVIMLIVNFITGKILWGIFWLIALVLALSYVVIKINTVYPTYLAMDSENVYMKTWTNDFLPYATDSPVKIFHEFIPAGTKLIQIPIDEIEAVMVGTKNFIKRYCVNDKKFASSIKPLERSKDFYQKRAFRNTDLVYISTYDGESYYMPVDKFEPKNVGRILQNISRMNPEAQLKISNREIRIAMSKK